MNEEVPANIRIFVYVQIMLSRWEHSPDLYRSLGFHGVEQSQNVISAIVVGRDVRVRRCQIGSCPTAALLMVRSLSLWNLDCRASWDIDGKERLVFRWSVQ